MKQLLDPVLQQPVDQSLQQRQLWKSLYSEGQTGKTVTNSTNESKCSRAQSSPWCRRLQTSLQCPEEEEEHIVQKGEMSTCIPEEELLRPVFTFISRDFPGAPASPYGDIKVNKNTQFPYRFQMRATKLYRVSFQALRSFITLKIKRQMSYRRNISVHFITQFHYEPHHRLTFIPGEP